MDYKNEIGRRIRQKRDEKGWTLPELARATDDVLTSTRIQNYETGYRMPGPSEAVILSKALGVRAAYLMAIDDIQIPITPQEEALIRNWRTMNERDRMQVYRSIETMAMQNRDPVQDQMVDLHMPPMPPVKVNRLPKMAVHKKVRR